MIFTTWIILSLLCGMFASNKGRSFFGYFLLSIVLSPLIGFIAVLISKEDTEKLEQKELVRGNKRKCPFCAEIVKVDAVVCKHCGKELEKLEEKEEPHVVTLGPSVKHGKAFFLVIFIFAMIMTYFIINKPPDGKSVRPNNNSSFSQQNRPDSNEGE